MRLTHAPALEKLIGLHANSKGILTQFIQATATATAATEMGATPSKVKLTPEQVTYLRNIVRLLKAVKNYPYINKRVTPFFEAAALFLNCINERRTHVELYVAARLVDVAFYRWQREAFGAAIIPADYHMYQPIELAWPRTEC